MHIHSALGNPGTEWFLYYRQTASAFADRGITMLRDGGDPKGLNAEYRNVFADRGIRFLSPVTGIFKQGCYGKSLGRPVADLAQGLDIVRSLKKSGADFIKIFVTGIMSMKEYGCTDSQPPGFSKEELRAITAEAGEAGLTVMAHVNTPAAILTAVEAGVLSVEHGYGMNRECLSAMAESGVYWVPTMIPIRALAESGNPPAWQYLREQQQAVREAFTAGVQVVPGADSGSALVPHAASTVQEYRLLEECGFSEEQLTANALSLFERTVSVLK